MDLNSKSPNDLTFEQATQLGVDTSMIAVCRKLRKLAKLDRLKIDDTQHWSGLNKHLFNYVNYCDRSVLDFIKSYLSNIQPYMIEREKIKNIKILLFV